jgi:DNA-binding NarL/FixJ family response regulator
MDENGGKIETSSRVCVAISLRDGVELLQEALTAVGFDVAATDGISEIADAFDGESPFVAVVDDSERGWLREVADLVRIRPDASLLALIEVETPEALLIALNAGVNGFVPPTAGLDAIVRSVQALVEGGVSIPRRMVSALVAEVRHGRGHIVQSAAGPVDVTDREWQILQLLVQRRSTREIAEGLYVSVGTVRSHISVLLGKLGAVDREDAIRLLECSLSRTSTP